MELTAWRITLARYAETAFDGEGARRYGGRFNSPGTSVIYVSSSLALAMLEVLVHVDRSRAMVGHVARPVTFDSGDVLALERDTLPERWDAPVPPLAVQELGDLWVASKASLLLRVPSVLLPGDVLGSEHNYLINPLHDHFSRLRIGTACKLTFDERLFR